jgi:hypothetical protein
MASLCTIILCLALANSVRNTTIPLLECWSQLRAALAESHHHRQEIVRQGTKLLLLSALPLYMLILIHGYYSQLLGASALN